MFESAENETYLQGMSAHSCPFCIDFRALFEVSLFARNSYSTFEIIRAVLDTFIGLVDAGLTSTTAL